MSLARVSLKWPHPLVCLTEVGPRGRVLSLKSALLLLGLLVLKRKRARDPGQADPVPEQPPPRRLQARLRFLQNHPGV